MELAEHLAPRDDWGFKDQLLWRCRGRERQPTRLYGYWLLAGREKKTERWGA